MIRRRWAVTFGIGLVTAALTAFWNTGCSIVGIRTWEEPAHEVVARDGRFQVRAYASTIVARTRVERAFDKSGGESFRRLAGYIFGDNDQGAKMAMTMPVAREPVNTDDAAAEAWEMRFFMPSARSIDTMPEPKDGRVVVEPSPPALLATYRYAGFQHAEDLERYGKALRNWAIDAGYEPTGSGWLAAYDPPWTIPVLRRNEVQIPVRAVEGP